MQSTSGNGLVNIMNADNLTNYKLFSETNISNDSFRKTAVGHFMQNCPLSDMFFSQLNIDALQEAIRYGVYKATDRQHIISRQSETELQIIMRGMYLEYGKNLPYDVVGQTRALNKRVLDHVIPKIVAELQQYVRYKKEISSMPVPLQHPTNMSSAGSRQLYMKEF